MTWKPPGQPPPIRDDLPTTDVDLRPDLGEDRVDEVTARGEARRDAENLQRIQRIVVLMQENRSFDHMLGYLSLPEDLGGRARTDVEGLKPGQSIPGPDRRPVEIRPVVDGVFLNSPGHTMGAIACQIANGAMNGFVNSFADVVEHARHEHPSRDHERPEQIVAYHTHATVPVYDFLAEHFTVCDRWFSCVPGPTWPNRMFLYAGTANNITDNGLSPISRYQSYKFRMPTDLIVDRLDAANVEWRVYRGSVIPWMRFFPSFLPDVTRHPELWNEWIARKRRVETFRHFERDCRRDNLPPVVFIDPNSNVNGREGGFDNDDTPPSDVARGQELIGQVYETLRRHGHLAETLLVITYDEHGGFYDHVAPDDLPSFTTDNDWKFTTFGVRVPAVVVSPFVDSRSTSHVRLDHTSITHSILLRFCPGHSMTPRVAAAPNLGQLLTRTTARPNLPGAQTAIDAAVDARSDRRGTDDPSLVIDPELLKELAF